MPMAPSLLALGAVNWLLLVPSVGGSTCLNGPCKPGNDFCGKPFENAPAFHLMDQHGCAENDPNGPVFDPVHGVIHHFFQIHLAAEPGHGPDYGHFVSKDFVNWAQLPVAIWNGLDASVWPPRETPYDNMAIFTGSAVIVDGAGPGGAGPGVVNIYPGLCNKEDWPSCKTGTLLAQAVPADYAGDALLTNWTKPAYNPIVENTQRDPSTPWRLPSGEWRLRSFDAMYGAASDADLLAGRWYELGGSKDFRTCECPSFYPLPPPTPGFEEDYEAAAKQGSLPTHVHKTSCGGKDWWQLGTYEAGAPKTTGHFIATAGWEDMYEQKVIDKGAFYASKDNEYPTKEGKPRRINWGWAQVLPQSAQTLPRIITFNPVARCLEQAPLEELQGLRGDVAYTGHDLKLGDGSGPADLKLASGVARQAETVLTFELPPHAATFGISIVSGDVALNCSVTYAPPGDGAAAFYEVPVSCGSFEDKLRILPKERSVQVRIFADNTFLEVFFQVGRVAMTVPTTLGADTRMELFSSAPMLVQAATVFPMRAIWVSPEAVRQAPRVYPAVGSHSMVEKFI